MDIEKVFALFGLFYNEEDGGSFLPVAELAAEHTERRALEKDEGYDPQLYFLAAAEALCRVLEIKAARERLTLTRTGTAASESDCAVRLEYAKRLYKSYEELCAGLIRDDGFLFLRAE